MRSTPVGVAVVALLLALMVPGSPPPVRAPGGGETTESAVGEPVVAAPESPVPAAPGPAAAADAPAPAAAPTGPEQVMPPAVPPAVAAPAVQPVFPAFSVVDPSKVYTYDQMTRDLAALQQAYPQWLEYRSIGQTDFGREIWAVRLGHGPATVLINAAHHACEWLTAAVAMAMLDDYASTAAAGGALDGEPAADLLNRATLWVVPMVNPDGVTLAQLGPDAFPAEARADLIRLNGGSTDFSR